MYIQYKLISPAKQVTFAFVTVGYSMKIQKKKWGRDRDIRKIYFWSWSSSLSLLLLLLLFLFLFFFSVEGT